MSLGLTVRQLWFALFATLLWSGIVVHAQVDRASLTNLDKRVSRDRIAARPAQQAARAALKQRTPEAEVDFDASLGSPKWVHSRGGFLTEANGEGGAVSRETAKRFDKDPDKGVKAFLQEHRELFRHGPEVLAGATKRRDHTNQSGLRTVAWEQQVDGIPVFDSVLVANTTARGELISISSLFVPGPDQAADRGTPNRAAKVRAPSVNAERALRLAAANLGEEISELTPSVERPAARTLKQNFKLKPLPGDASAGLVWLPLDGDTLRLCWDVELSRREFSERFRLLIDAETGEVLVRRKLTVEVSEVLYRVYTSDSPSPLSPGFAFPTNSQPTNVARPLLIISNLNATASPLGWINDGVMETRGNNVDAHLDRDADDRPDLPRPQATLDANNRRVFDFPIDFSKSPTTYTNAAVVQLFYWCNFMHDKLYELGFTESAGNFQKDNFGRGGVDNDAMSADAQDGSGVNNANFTPARDGSSGKIQMFLFTGPSPARDGDLDAEVVLHEYTHGLTDRLVGGGVGIDFFGHIQTGGMGEGWSDFYALSLLSEFSDDPGANYAMSGYVTYQFSGLLQNYYYGIRRYPYTTNLNADPLTLKDIDASTASLHSGIPRNPIIISSGNEVHRQGEIWCSMLWDMRAALLRKYAPTNATQFTNVNMRILGYVTRGLQLAPPNPSFAQARDAILLAIRLTVGAESDTNEAWWTFARRGLGLSAVCPDSTTTVGVVEGYDTPQRPEFDVQPNQSITFVGVVGGPFAPQSITNTLLNSSGANVAWSAAVNVSWLKLSANNGVLTPNVPFTNIVSITPAATVLPVANYPGTIFYTNIARGQVVAIQVLLQVKPLQSDPLVVTPSGTFQFAGPVGGPFVYAAPSCLLANSGAAPVNWRAFTTGPWLTVSPTEGTLADNTTFTNVTITLNSNANALISGTYVGSVSVINTNTSAQVDVPVTLRVGTPDYFTENFENRVFDLSFSTLTLTPDLADNFYRVCHESASVFPTDPAGSTPIVALGDDEYRQVILTNGRTVSIYGISSNAIYIGANGNLTFDPGTDTNSFRPDLGFDEFFAHTRVAPFYGDLNPAAGGTVSYAQLEDRFVVTWQDVPEFGTANPNSLQVELFYGGTVRMTWLQAQITNPFDPTLYVGISRGVGYPADFVPSDLSAFGPCLPGANLVVPSRAVEGDGSLQGTLLLSGPLLNDLVVTLTCNNTNEVVVPATVLVPAGQVSVPFLFRTIFDSIPDGTQQAIITADFPDRPSVSASILVDDSDTANLTLNVVPSGTEGGVLSGGGLVTADVIAVNPITVNLVSYNTNRVRVPPFVVIQPGHSSANFDITLVNNDLLDGTENVVIEASVVNWMGDFDVIRVNDDESRALSLTLPVEVTEGQGTLTNAGTISFSGKPLTNVVLALKSDQPSLVTVPVFVTNVAGQTSVRFDLVVSDNSVTNAFDSAHITASATGFISATSTVAVIDDERPFAPSNPTPANFATHVARDTMLRWTNNSRAPGTVYYVYLGTNAVLSTNDFIASTSGQSLALPRQLNPDTTYYWKVIARLAPFPDAPGDVWQFRTATFGFAISTIGSPQFVGEPFPIFVTARDEFGLVVTNYKGSVLLTNSAPVQSSSTILITEIEVSGFRRIEFENVSGHAINIAGWKIALYDWQSWPAPLTVYTVPSPSVANAGDLFQLRNILPQFFPGTYPLFSSAMPAAWNDNVLNNPIAVLLLDGVGNIVDFVCAAGADPALITQPVTVPTAQWAGPPITALADGTMSYQRIGRLDLNSSNNWVFGARTIGTNNVGMSSPFSDTAAIPFTAPPLNNFVAGVCTVSLTMLDQGRGATVGVADTAGRGALSNPFDVLSRDDIGLSVAAPGDVVVRDPVTYRFTITNTGPSAATSVTLTDILSTNSDFISATPSQGTCSVTNGVVTCQLGSLTADAAANVTVVATALNRAVLTNFAAITRSETDAYLPNNSATTLTTATYPQVSIFDRTNTEPNTGTSTILFSVRLSAASTLTSTVAYATSDGTATGGVDYQPSNGLVTFLPGVTNQTISILINGDTLSESNETFFVNLSNATNAEMSKATGLGTITDNDGNPSLSVSDVTLTEGDSGATLAVFSITLSAASGKIVGIGYATGDGTALAGLDYQEAYGTLVFPPGVTNLTVTVPVFGDTVPEPTKIFFVNLLNPLNAFLLKGQGVATILDNDLAPIDSFTFEPINGTNYAGAPVPMTITARDGNGAIAAGFNDAATLLVLQDEHPVTVGSNTTTWGLPFGTSFHDARLQSIYLTNEIGAPGRIIGLALDVATVPAQIMSNFTIRLRATPDDRYIASTWFVFGWVTNFQHDVSVSSTGWVTFAFSTPFLYDGRNHLMVDFSFDNSSFTADGLCRSTATALNRSVYLRTDSAYGNPLDWIALVTTPAPTPIARVPNVRLLMDRATSAAPVVTGNFVNGVWSGTVALNTSASNALLRVVDGGGHFGESNPFTLILLRIFSITRNGAAVDINFPTLNGSHYVVESSTALNGSWNPVSPTLTGDGGMAHFTHTPPVAQQFYRVRLAP